MARLLYWCVYHLDLGPLGPSALTLALKTWHEEAKGHALLRAFVMVSAAIALAQTRSRPVLGRSA
jgi:hypothetical protein